MVECTRIPIGMDGCVGHDARPGSSALGKCGWESRAIPVTVNADGGETASPMQRGPVRTKRSRNAHPSHSALEREVPAMLGSCFARDRARFDVRKRWISLKSWCPCSSPSRLPFLWCQVPPGPRRLRLTATRRRALPLRRRLPLRIRAPLRKAKRILLEKRWPRPSKPLRLPAFPTLPAKKPFLPSNRPIRMRWRADLPPWRAPRRLRAGLRKPQESRRAAW